MWNVKRIYGFQKKKVWIHKREEGHYANREMIEISKHKWEEIYNNKN